ncbi:MAG: TetR/AcrR family transcriptional regulator [Propionibacteriaceae bacterium]
MARPREFDDAATLHELTDEFWDHGYHATSTDDLCRRTGLSRSSLYNAYGKKRDCYLQTLQCYSEQSSTQRQEILAGELGGRESLRVFMISVLDRQWADADRRVCLMINASVEVGPSDEGVHDSLQRNAMGFRAAVLELVQRGQGDGSVTTAQSAEALAFALHASLDGLQVQGRIVDDRSMIDEAVDTLLALL